jgi:hypothetical protein
MLEPSFPAQNHCLGQGVFFCFEFHSDYF